MKLPNIVTRILSGFVFIVILIGGIILNQYTFAVVFGLVTGLCIWEFYGLMENKAGVSLSKGQNLAGALLLYGGGYLYVTWGSLIQLSILICIIPYLIYLLSLFISELYMKRTDPLKSLAYSLFGQLYIALPFTSAFYIAFINSSYTPLFMLAVLIIIWVNDTFAYLTGMSIGKHRLFERISPKKSWEGFIGGCIAAIIASIIISHYSSSSLTIAQWIGFALIVVIFGTWGDLFESMIKRTIGVKDSGNMIPGHGGPLDRFDSTIFAIPAIGIYLAILTQLN